MSRWTILLLWLMCPHVHAQTSVLRQENGFTLRQEHDSLYYLNDWRLPYPVYQFQTGEKARRLFIFKQVNDKARPLWMGSKLGGILEDFRFVDGKIRALETTTDSLYVVTEYRWEGFGMTFDHFLIKGTDQQPAITTYRQ